jgi:hypothetical protein
MWPCLYLMSPAFWSVLATTLTVGLVEPSIMARNSWLR